MVEYSPDSFERLRQTRLIAEHGDSAIWLARQPEGQQFAVKTLSTPIFAWRVRSLFMQRLQLALRIHHPHLAPIYAGRVRGPNQCVVVTDYCERGSLYDAVSGGARRVWAAPLPPGEAVRLVAEIAAGAYALHERGLLHGGLKLTNVLLDVGADGALHARVTDLLLHAGVTGAVQPSKGITGWRDPFLYYAPEQWRRRPALASDQYALAVIAFLLLTGEAPFAEPPQTLALAKAFPAPLRASAQNPILPPGIDAPLDRALRGAPKDRFPTILDFAVALQEQTPREFARALQLPRGSIPAPRSVGVEPITEPHEAVRPLPPLAILQAGSADSPPDMPDLPPQYSWTAEVMAQFAHPGAAAARQRAERRRAVARRASTVALWIAVVVTVTLIIALTVLLMSAMRH